MFRLVDTAIVGRLGTQELGGVAVAVSVLSLVIAGSNFLAYGTTQHVSHRRGAGHAAQAADTGIQALWAALAIGVTAAPLLALWAPQLATVMGANGEIRDIASTYLRISALGVPFVIVGIAAQGVQRGNGDFRSGLIVLVAANIANAGLEVLFVFGFDQGVAGAAWSTVIAQTGASVALAWRTVAHLVAAPRCRPAWSEMGPLLTAGRHLVLRTASILAVFTGATAVAARIDDPTLAAHQIAVSLFLFIALSLDALAVPTQTLVAEELGCDSGNAAHVAARAQRLSVSVGVGLAVIVAASSPLLARAFSSDLAVVSRATVAIALLGLVLVPGSAAFGTDGALIGAGDYRFLGRAAFAYAVAVLPIAGAVLVAPALGIAGIWAGLAIWMLMRSVVNRRRLAMLLPSRNLVASAGPNRQE